MTTIQRSAAVLATLAVLTTTGTATAQIPDEFTNLEILPKDIGKREMVSVMRGWASALGKRCNYCHVGEANARLSTYDFASDEKETKIKTRTMMKMTAAINDTYMPELNVADVKRVSCVTCHHGVTEPETMNNILLTVAQEEGADASMAKYREMREEYYGQGAYNFGASPLNDVAEKISDANLAGAIAIMEMNVEFHGDKQYTHLFLGQLYSAAGDKEKAIKSIERSLAIEPDNQWAKNILDQIKAGE